MYFIIGFSLSLSNDDKSIVPHYSESRKVFSILVYGNIKNKSSRVPGRGSRHWSSPNLKVGEMLFVCYS